MRYGKRVRKSMSYPISILYDDREKKPWKFNEKKFFMKRARLEVGDYTIRGLDHRFSIERKGSLKEVLVNSTGSNSSGFKEQMYRLSKLDCGILVIEDDFSNVGRAVRELQSTVKKVRWDKNTAMRWLSSVIGEFDVPVLFVGNKRKLSTKFVEHIILNAYKYRL